MDGWLGQLGLFFVVVILTKPLLRVASASFVISTMAGEFTEKIMSGADRIHILRPAPTDYSRLSCGKAVPAGNIVEILADFWVDLKNADSTGPGHDADKTAASIIQEWKGSIIYLMDFVRVFESTGLMEIKNVHFLVIGETVAGVLSDSEERKLFVEKAGAKVIAEPTSCIEWIGHFFSDTVIRIADTKFRTKPNPNVWALTCFFTHGRAR